MKAAVDLRNLTPNAREFMESEIEIGMVPGDGARARPERADAAANRRLILATAESLFAEQGVEAVTMADIAQAAGVGKGTLYRRFANKPELCLVLMDEQMLAFQNETLAHLRELATRGTPISKQLDFFLDTLVYFTDRHLPLLCEVQRAGLLSTGHDHESPHIWQHITIKGLLNTAVLAGELSPEVDVEYTADALLAPLRVTLFRFQREWRGFSLERISDGLQGMAGGLFVLGK
jgi:AcrR family transcriptional regulator